MTELLAADPLKLALVALVVVLAIALKVVGGRSGGIFGLERRTNPDRRSYEDNDEGGVGSAMRRLVESHVTKTLEQIPQPLAKHVDERVEHKIRGLAGTPDVRRALLGSLFDARVPERLTKLEADGENREERLRQAEADIREGRDEDDNLRKELFAHIDALGKRLEERITREVDGLRDFLKGSKA